MEASLSASEWLDWQRFFADEPFGTPLHDVMQAQLRALLANINRNEKVRPEPFEARDFLLFLPPEPQVPEAPELINGLTPAEWRLAMYLRAYEERQSQPHHQE